MIKILAIDDRVDNLITISTLLKNTFPDCTVITAQSGDEGIKKAGEELPDTILLDIRMPQMDGFEVCRRLKAGKNTRHIPILMLTAVHSDSESKIKGLELGADAFLSKPIDHAELAAQVKVMLRIKKAEDDLRKKNGFLEEMVQERTTELRLEQDKLQGVLAAIGEGMHIVTSDYRIVMYANQDITRMLGTDDLKEQICYEIFRDRNTPCDSCPMRRAIERGKAETEEVTDPDGRVIEISASPLMLPTGEMAAIKIIKDITSRKMADEALRESELRLKALFETMNEGVILISPDARIIQANPAAGDILGLKHSEVNGRYMVEWNILEPDGAPMPPGESPAFRVIHEKRPVRDSVAGIKRPDGTIAWVNISAVPLMDETGMLEGVVSTFMDITEKKKAEDALKESERRYRYLAENVTDVIWVIDLDLKPAYVSPSVARLLGYSVEEAMALRGETLYTPSSLEVFQKVYLEEMTREKSGIDPGRPWVLDLEEKRKDGSIIWAEITMRFIHGPDGRPAGLLGVTRDITVRKQAEKKIYRYSEELEMLVKMRTERIHELEKRQREAEKLAATGRMAARVAHEINSPLANIKNSFLLVKDTIPENHSSYDYVLRIEKEINRIARIVHQMIDLYRPAQESVREFHLKEAMSDIVALLKAACGEKGISIVTELPTTPISVFLSEDSLRQILFNIIQNAIEASPYGGVVKITAAANENHLCILVADQGTGIPESKTSQIFEPFFTTKSDLPRGGFGLGLSISQSLVEAMGGSLNFESRVGQGTAFRILLPRRILRKELIDD